MEDIYDVIVIGGGMCGLYFAYKYKGKCLLLERSNRLGGRSYTIDFHNVSIALGTGIGIYNRDTLLLELLNELGIEYSTYLTDMENRECLNILIKLYKKLPDEDITFMEYINNILTPDEISLLLSEGGYTDYLDANARVTLLHYGLQYNYSKYLGFGVRWDIVVDKISNNINYLLNCRVDRLIGNIVVTNNGVYRARNIVVATTITSIRKLIDDPIYNNVRSHPFLRVYAYFNDDTTMKRHFSRSKRTYNLLHFIHPIRDKVYMIAYTDGKDAIELYKELSRSDYIEIMETYLESLIDERIVIDDIIIAYWEEGTHYMTKSVDIDHLRHPRDNVYVIGEAVSEVSGWTSPALEIVERLTREL